VLFDDLRACRRLEALIEREKPTAIYFDTVRCFTFIRRIARRFPEIALICDFDDLMSRRMYLVRSLSEKLSIGYMDRWMGRWMKQVLESQRLSNMILEHEAAALARIESEIGQLVDGVVMLSSVDADAFRGDVGASSPCDIDAIPPPFIARRPIDLEMDGLRFVFVGSDRLLQNRLSIAMLLRIWKEHKISYPLHIYGHQSRSKVQSVNVFWPGFAEDLDDVYTRNSILVAPAVIGGGIKTKMLEALAFGTIPLGNRLSFEGIEGSEDLAMIDDQLIYTLTHLPDRISFLLNAAQKLQDHLTGHSGVDVFRSRWLRLFNMN
jgi:glycosyltransferase involved in cell wall biosynthesis